MTRQRMSLLEVIGFVVWAGQVEQAREQGAEDRDHAQDHQNEQDDFQRRVPRARSTKNVGGM